MRSTRIPLLILTGLLASVLAASSYAQNQPPNSPSPTAATAPAATAQPSTSPTDASALAESVRFEREVLERQSDRQTQAIITIAQIGGGVLSIILAGGIGLFIWLFGSTRKELRESLEEIANRQIKDLVEAQADGVRSQVKRIEAELELLRHRRSPVTWIARDEKDSSNELVALLQARDVDLSAVIPAEGEPFEIGSPELVIVSYVATPEGNRRLREVIRSLKDRTPQVPIVVYTFDPTRESNRLLAADEALLSEYRWYVPANFPLQLVAHVNSLISRHRTGMFR